MVTPTGPTGEAARPPRAEEGRAVRPVIFPPLLFLVALLVGVAVEQIVPFTTFESGWMGHAVGWPVFLLGALLARSAEKTMREDDVDPRFKPVGTIIVTGMFARSRNPLYLSASLAYTGLAIVCNTWWPFILYPAVFAILHYGVVLREERYLQERFGNAYRDYCARVRRWV